MTAVVVASAFGAVVALIAWLEPEPTRHSRDDVYEGFPIEWYSKELTALEEPSLYAQRWSSGKAYRVVWFPYDFL